MLKQMTLLEEIQVAATGNDSVAILLRKCKLLSARINNEEFERWLSSELAGYQNGQPLPAYRIKSNLTHHAQISIATNGFAMPRTIILASTDLPDPWHSELSVKITDSVAGIEKLLQDSKPHAVFDRYWPNRLFAEFAQGLPENEKCKSAKTLIPVSVFSAVIDAIRTRVLDFSIEIAKKYPGIADGPISATPRESEAVNTIVHNTIYAENSSLTIAGHASSSTIVVSLQTLMQKIDESDIPTEEKESLIQRIKSLLENNSVASVLGGIVGAGMA
jgi:hypothetical protein